MPYQVEWRPIAQNLLADIWLRAPDRNAITIASNQVDKELEVAPETKGLDFYGDRLLVIAPLHVVFNVDEANQQVNVLYVWSV